MIQLTNCVERFSKLILSELNESDIKCWIAGGSIRDYFSGQPMKTDLDIFFPSLEQFNKCKQFFENKAAEIKWESDNGCKVVSNGKTFDLVKKFFANPQETIDAFDFTVSMFAVDIEKVYYGETSFIDLSKRQLMINKLPFPGSTLTRAFRYYQKGYKMCKGEMKKLIEAIQNIPKKEETNQHSDSNATDQEISGDSIFSGID